MSLANRESRVVTAAAANLNQAANTILLTFIASKPIMIQRFAVVPDAALGLLAAMRLKLRLTPVTTGTAADLGTDILVGAVKARGLGIFKDITGPANGLRVDAGDTVTVTVSVDAGAASTGDVSLEYWELPFAGTEISDWSEST